MEGVAKAIVLNIAGRLLNFLIGIDVAMAGLLGFPRYMTISGAIGKSIMAKEWAANIDWPDWWVRHCERSDFVAEV